MEPIPQLPGPRCDCCGTPIHLQAGDFCPRCGYPVSTPKEEHFLEESIRNLKRVAAYGGSQATVASLLLRYQTRLSVIRRQLYVAPARQNVLPAPRSEVVLTPSTEHLVPSTQPNNAVLPSADIPQTSTVHTSVSSPTQPNVSHVVLEPTAPQRMFSLRSFFADQTINIVSSLGAFLILIGSLSFVVTTTNLFLSFLVLFIVHLIFATVGFVFARYPSFLFISRIYTAIFALLIPLVGFSGYRLVAGHLIQLSAPTVVAIAASYAAIVYAVLAVSQQYKLFGYLAAVALVLVGCAVAFAFQLNYWWWPVLLMPLAFAGLLSMGNRGVLRGNNAVLREPLRILTYVCVGMLCLDIFCTYLFVIALGQIGHPFSEIRIVGAIMFLQVLVWTCMYIWATKLYTWLAVLPYQFLGFVIALAYVFDMRAVGYGLLFTALAAFYHIDVLVARNPFQRLQRVRNHTEGIAIALVAFVPLLVAPQVPLNLLEVVYSGHDIQFSFNGDTLLALIALFVSCVLIVSIVLHRTSWHRTPTYPYTVWCWLLLLSGFLFTWAYSIVALSIHIVIAYEFLALTLVLLIGTVIVRRFISASWANPIDVLVLVEAALTLLLHFKYGINANITLLFLFAALSYCVVVYQRRLLLLFMPIVFMLLAFPGLVERPRIMLLLGVGLPLVSLIIASIGHNRRENATVNNSKITLNALFSWDWPILASGLFYGVVVCAIDALASTSTIQSLFGVPFSVALEMASLALIWYIVAALKRQEWMLIVTIGFAIAGLLVPSNPLWVMASIAGVAALLAVGVGRIGTKMWAIPLYTVAILAAILMGIDGYTAGPGQFAFVSWALLGFALLIYSIGVTEDFVPFLWLAPVFAIWSAYDATLLGDLYRPPVVALLCATIGVGIGCLRFISTSFTPRKDALLQFSLPFYVTALAAAVLTGVYGVIGGINHPFPTAIPDALLLYALVAYAILVFERQSRSLWIVALFALWGTVLVVRLNADVFTSFSTQIAFPTYYLTGLALVTGGIAMVAGRLSKTRDISSPFELAAFIWSWPWYCTSLVAIALTIAWNTLMGGAQVVGVTVYGSLFAFILLGCAVMLVERRFELLIIPVSLALWGIVQTHWEPWQQMGALSILFFLVFATRYIWRLLPSQTRNSSYVIWYTLLGFGGQVVLLLMIIGQGGLSPDAGVLAHVGIGILLLLAVQLFLYGWAQQNKQYWTIYVAGLLVALAVPWELITFHLTRIEWLSLAPATYLIVIAPFLSRNERMVEHHRIGQLCSILGASLLLLPTLWSSFSEPSIQPTFILAGEALILLLLGVTMRIRFFVLSGAALVIVSAMHALFLPSLGLPPSLALTIMGVTLLALATGLSLARHRLQTVWTNLD